MTSDDGLQTGGYRLVLGGGLNVILILSLVIIPLSGALMSAAETWLGAPVRWPQIAFMSAYPDDVRSGYLLFVLATAIGVLVASGLFGGLMGASPGKWIFGIRYRTSDGQRCGMRRMMVRSILCVCALLPALLIGPILGFVFRDAADTASLIALAAGPFSCYGARCR